MSCIFCDIAAGNIPCTIMYEDASVIAFNDVNPKAPTHILVIPKAHYDSVLDLQHKNATLMVDIFNAISKIAEKTQLAVSGFRVVTNTGVDGGQTVNHLHFHVLGGRALDWPPG